MAKVIASVCALLVYGSLGAASVGGEPLRMSESLGVESATRTGVEESATSEPAEFVPMGGMSNAEKERRKQVCENEWEACYDQCNRFYANPRGKKKLPKCIQDCRDKLAECMKKIPY